jgi:hypothetical protein
MWRRRHRPLQQGFCFQAVRDKDLLLVLAPRCQHTNLYANLQLEPFITNVHGEITRLVFPSNISAMTTNRRIFEVGNFLTQARIFPANSFFTRNMHPYHLSDISCRCSLSQQFVRTHEARISLPCWSQERNSRVISWNEMMSSEGRARSSCRTPSNRDLSSSLSNHTFQVARFSVVSCLGNGEWLETGYHSWPFSNSVSLSTYP